MQTILSESRSLTKFSGLMYQQTNYTSSSPFFPANILLNPWWLILLHVSSVVPWNSSLSSSQSSGQFSFISAFIVMYFRYSCGFWMRLTSIISHFDGGRVIWNVFKALLYSSEWLASVTTWQIFCLPFVPIGCESQWDGPNATIL